MAVALTPEQIKVFNEATATIPRQKLETLITNEETVNRISGKLVACWRPKAFLLKLNNDEVFAITHGENNGNPGLQSLEALQGWLNKTPLGATYENLIKICIKGEWTPALYEIIGILTEEATAEGIKPSQVEKRGDRRNIVHPGAPSNGSDSECSATSTGLSRVQPPAATINNDINGSGVTDILKSDAMKKKYHKLKEKLTERGLEKLDKDIESDQHLRLMAEKLSDWEKKPDLLGLSPTPDVKDIMEKYSRDPYKQRKYALVAWKDGAAESTYHCLLCICVAGEWMDSANVIIELLEKEEKDDVTDILETKELKTKYAKFMKKISEDKRAHLNKDISDDGHLRHIAAKLTGWEDKPDLLGLQDNPDVQDIVHSRDNPYAQKREALERWRERQVDPTYHNLLCICIAGNWKDAANEIVVLINTTA